LASWKLELSKQGDVASRVRVVPILVGLLLVWAGTLLIDPVSRLYAAEGTLAEAVIGQVAFWLLGVAVILHVRFRERQPLRSLWLKPFQWQSIAWGLALVAVNYAVLLPTGEFVRRSAGLPGFAAGMEPIMALPLWYRVWAVLGAGVIEEILFRGYTVTRLAALLGRPWLAGAIALVAFALLHVPLWGWGFAVGGLFGGAVVMAVFLWRRDLLAMVVFHLVTDAVGIVVAPTFSQWWRSPLWS
jgi:membrane protease YdiL (CAAX protease family)